MLLVSGICFSTRAQREGLLLWYFLHIVLKQLKQMHRKRAHQRAYINLLFISSYNANVPLNKGEFKEG